jgi:hypothetical protein
LKPDPVPSVLVQGKLRIGRDGGFVPDDPYVWPQLAEILDLGEYSTIEEMEGFHGGLNEGIWFLESGEEKLVLKLVKCGRIDPTVLTEAENCLRLYREHPGIVSDPVLAFPRWVLSCRVEKTMARDDDADAALTSDFDFGGQRRYDLLVMRKVRGVGLSEVVAAKRLANQIPELFRLFERLGEALRDFHVRYGSCQHGDFQPGNIFYEEAGDAFTFIDVGGMGIPTADSDIDHFCMALKHFEQACGAEFIECGLQRFKLGYQGPRAEERESPM